MKRTLKGCIITVLGLFVALSAVTLAFSEENAELTNLEFTELLVGAIGLELPAGSEDLPEDVYYEVLSNILAEAGIDNFVDTASDTVVTCSVFVSSVYGLVEGPAGLTIDDELQYLIENFQMTEYNLDDPITLTLASQVLNDPAFSALVAEAYSPPGVGAAGLEAPGFTLEDIPSET